MPSVSYTIHFILVLFKILLYRFLKTKKPATLIPILPLSFIVGYQADFAYGDKITRVQGKLKIPELGFHW